MMERMVVPFDSTEDSHTEPVTVIGVYACYPDDKYLDLVVHL